MVLRVKLLGSGTQADPFRVNLPTYQLLHGNVTHGYALVTIPDTVHEAITNDLEGEKYEETTEGRLYFLSDTALAKLHGHWDSTKYREHKGKFRVDQV